MITHYLLWATGKDRPGIVASITEILYRHNCNLEDSSMMRLGSEFGVLLIFTSKKKISITHQKDLFQSLAKKLKLSIGFKKITAREALYQPLKKTPYIVSVHGPDHPGIVFRVTSLLSRSGFNITDLSTHRTTKGGKTGYILLIEGEPKDQNGLKTIKSNLPKLQKKLRSKIVVHPVKAQPF